MIYRKLHEDVFQATIWVIADATVDQANKVMKRWKLPEDSAMGSLQGMTSTYTSDLGGGGKKTIYLVWLGDGSDIHTVYHESLHLVKRIFNDRGIKFADDQEEGIAYYQNYWGQQLQQLLNKSQSKKSAKAKGNKKPGV